VAASAQRAGFQGQTLQIAVAVGLAESGGNPGANRHNPPTPGCPDGSVDRGPWQLNDCYHPEVSDGCAYQPDCAATQTYRISAAGSDWSSWTTFATGAYRAQLVAAEQAIANLDTGVAPAATAHRGRAACRQPPTTPSTW
jgi:Lysozyme like domain